MQPDLNATKEATVLSLLIRSKCFEDCNPGSLKQRMIKHSRDNAENWAKLERYKSGCAAGCNFGAHAEKGMSAAERGQVVQALWEEEKRHVKVVESDDSDRLRVQREHSSSSMRQKCFDRCLVEFKGDHKMQHYCSDGCDSFFNIIHN